MQQQLAVERAKMEEEFSIKMACINADAKAERQSAFSKMQQDIQEFEVQCVRKPATRSLASQYNREQKGRQLRH